MLLLHCCAAHLVNECLKTNLAKVVDCVQSASNVGHSTMHEVKLCYSTCKKFIRCLRPRLEPEVTVEKTLAQFVYVRRQSDYRHSL